MPNKFEQFLQRSEQRSESVPESPVMILTEAGLTPAGYEEVMDRDYSGEGYPTGWTGEEEMALVPFSNTSDFDPKSKVGIREQFAAHLKKNPDFNMNPRGAVAAEEPGDTGDTGDTGLYTSPSEAISRNPDIQADLKAKTLAAARKAQRDHEAKFSMPEEGSQDLAEIAKQVTGGGEWPGWKKGPTIKSYIQHFQDEDKKIKDNKSLAMAAAINALHPQKASEVPRAIRMRESKRDVREDEEKK